MNMNSRSFGYVRVSTRDQCEDRQLDAMLRSGVPPENIVVEKQSGKDFQRPKYQRLIRSLRPGDSLVLKSIDRLGRNYSEILEQWRLLTKERDVDIVVLDLPLLDTRRDRDLTGLLISDIVLQLMSYVAQTERECIRQRQREGIAAAKARGVSFGRPRSPLPEGFYEAVQAWRSGACSGRQAAEGLSISRSRFYQRAKELGL